MNTMACYRLVEAVILKAFEDSSDFNKVKKVLAWTKSEMGEKFFDAWGSLSGYDPEKTRKILINKCDDTIKGRT